MERPSEYDQREKLAPELLLISWPNTDDLDFVNCVKGWHAARGERLAVIYDPADEQAYVPGPFLEEVPGKDSCKMKHVLNDREGGINRYDSHMPHGIYQEANHAYGLYTFRRVNRRGRRDR